MLNVLSLPIKPEQKEKLKINRDKEEEKKKILRAIWEYFDASFLPEDWSLSKQLSTCLKYLQQKSQGPLKIWKLQINSDFACLTLMHTLKHTTNPFLFLHIHQSPSASGKSLPPNFNVYISTWQQALLQIPLGPFQNF